MNKLFCFGYGYSAQALAQQLRGQDAHWHIAGSTRSRDKALQMQSQNVEAVLIEEQSDAVFLQDVTHILISIPPDADGCPVFRHYTEAINMLPHLTWLGLCSTTGVYGDAGGDWVDENTPTYPENERSSNRIKAETQWLSMVDGGVPTHIFRLSGIYGPGRSALDRLRSGSARRIVKEGHYFSRIHMEDIANVLAASIAEPQAGEIYNVADDYPCPSHEVMEYAATLLGIEPPELENFDDADMSDMMRSFYAANKRVSNKKIKQSLGVKLAYPTYKHGLSAIAKEMMT